MKIIEKKLDLYVSSILWVHQEFSNEVYILQVYFEPVFEYIFLMSQKYSWSGLTKLMYLLSNSEVYMKYTF